MVPACNAQNSEAPHEVGHLNPQGRSQAHQRIHGDVFLAALDVADVVGMQISPLGEPFLGQPGLQAVEQDVLTQNPAMLAGDWHPSTQTRTAGGNHRIYTGFGFTPTQRPAMNLFRRRAALWEV